MLPIAVQLYSLRDALAADFVGVVERLATVGYAGVETAGSYGGSPKFARDLFDNLGLRVSSAHSPLPLGDSKQAVLDTIQQLGATTLVFPWIAPETFRSLEGIQRLADQLNEADAILRAANIKLAYHNHDFEFTPWADGTIPHQQLQRLIAPTIGFELDTYWIKVAGSDPAQVVRDLADRTPLLHLKDGLIDPVKPMVALGDGVLDFPSIVAATKAEWLIVELDECGTDMLTAVEQSYHYLISKGLGHGR
jgi:sugar phosphate isomerase/epimerase